MIKRIGKEFEVNGKLYHSFEAAREAMGASGPLSDGNLTLWGRTVSDEDNRAQAAADYMKDCYLNYMYDKLTGFTGGKSNKTAIKKEIQKLKKITFNNRD